MMSDEELLSCIARQTEAGAETALATLYDRYAPRIFGLIFQILKNQTDADDVVQETYLQVWQQAGRFDPSKGKPASWIMMLARSRAIDRLRKKQHVLHASPETLPEVPSPLMETEEALLHKESKAILCSALCQLPREQQESIRLAFYEGFTHMEIAERLQQPLGTIKTRIRTGMLKMRELLSERGVISA